MTIVGDKERARKTDRDRLKAIEELLRQGKLEEAHHLQKVHDEQQKIRADYNS